MPFLGGILYYIIWWVFSPSSSLAVAGFLGGENDPPEGVPHPPPHGEAKKGNFVPPPRNASPGPPRGGSGPSSIDPPLPTPPGPGGVHCVCPYNRGNQGERWGRD